MKASTTQAGAAKLPASQVTIKSRSGDFELEAQGSEWACDWVIGSQRQVDKDELVPRMHEQF